MPYQIYKFGSLDLPAYDADDDVGLGPFRDLSLELPDDGVYDLLGADDAPVGRQRLSRKSWLMADTNAQLRTDFNAVRALAGTRDKLWRQWGDGTQEWVYARLSRIDGSRTRNNVLEIQLSLLFDVLSPVWNAQNQTSTSDTFTSSPDSVVVTNNGNAPVKDAIITISATSAGIDTFTLSCNNAEWTFSGGVSPGQSLVIDCGARSIKRSGVNVYSDFAFTVNHQQSNWLTLEPGNNTITVTFSGTPGTVEVGSWVGVRTVPTYAEATVLSESLSIQVDFYDAWR